MNSIIFFLEVWNDKWKLLRFTESLQLELSQRMLRGVLFEGMFCKIKEMRTKVIVEVAIFLLKKSFIILHPLSFVDAFAESCKKMSQHWSKCPAFDLLYLSFCFCVNTGGFFTLLTFYFTCFFHWKSILSSYTFKYMRTFQFIWNKLITSDCSFLFILCATLGSGSC